jgi:hypothetical protein
MQRGVLSSTFTREVNEGGHEEESQAHGSEEENQEESHQEESHEEESPQESAQESRQEDRDVGFSRVS